MPTSAFVGTLKPYHDSHVRQATTRGWLAMTHCSGGGAFRRRRTCSAGVMSPLGALLRIGGWVEFFREKRRDVDAPVRIRTLDAADGDDDQVIHADDE